MPRCTRWQTRLLGQRMRKFLVCSALLAQALTVSTALMVLMALALPAHAAGVATDAGFAMRWTQDASGALTAEQLMTSVADEGANSRWQPLLPDTQLPTGRKGAVWLHLKVAPRPDAAAQYLEFERARVLRIDRYGVNAAGQLGKQSAGFVVPFAQRALPTQHPTFAIDVPPGKSLDYLFKVQHLAPLTLAPRLLVSSAFADSSRSNGLIDGMLMGGLLAFALACAVAGTFKRHLSFVWPALLALTAAFVFAPSLGLTARWLWPTNGQLDRTVSWAAAPLVACASALALWALLRGTATAKRARRVLLATTALMGALVLLHFVQPLLIGLAWQRAAGLLATLAMLWACAQYTALGVRWAQWALWGLVPVALMGVPRLLRALGWIDNSDWIELGGAAAYMAQSVLLFFAVMEASSSRQLRTAVDQALTPVDANTGLNTWRVCLEAVARVIQRPNTPAQSASVVTIKLVNMDALARQTSSSAARLVAVALGHRLRALGQPLDTVALAAPDTLVWVIDQPMTQQQLIELGHRVRIANTQPYEALGGANLLAEGGAAPALLPQLTMVCSYCPPSVLNAEAVVDMAASTAELATSNVDANGAGAQRSMQFVVFA